MKTLFKWFGNILFTIIIICAILFVISCIKSKNNSTNIPGIGPYTFMSVISGSMSPTFNVYDMIIDKKLAPENLKKGDVITFWKDNKTLVTHRIVGIQNQNGKIAYMTRGDANNVNDKELVDSSNVEGTYLFRIPYVGLIITRLREPIILTIIWVLFLYAMLSEFVFRKKNNNKVIGVEKSKIKT